MGNLLSFQEFIERLRVSRDLGYQIIKQPGFPVCKVGRKKILIPEDKLQEWIEQGGLRETIKRG